MTTATLTVSRSQYTTAPHHAHFSGSTSTVTTGTLRDAQFEWWVQDLSDGSTVTSSFSGPEFGHVFDTPGSYRITFKLKGSGDVAWSEDSEDFTVGTASYQAECWVDMDAGSDGVGTLLDPFNTIASAISYIDTEWVAGATNEHAIHLKAGTSETLAGGYGTKTSAGRLVIDAYGSGVRPIIDLNDGNFSIMRIEDDRKIAVVGVEVDGGAVYPPSAGAEFFVMVNDEANTPVGFDSIFHDCYFHNSRSSCLYWAIDNATNAGTAAGCYDHIAITECEFADNAADWLTFSASTGTAVRYFTDTSTYGRTSSFGSRIGMVQHAYLRHNRPLSTGSNVALRIHSGGVAGCNSEWIVLDRCTLLRSCWFQPDSGSGAARDLNYLWIDRCYFANASGEYVVLDVFANSNLVVRNSIFYCIYNNGACVSYRGSDANITTGADWLIENNTFVHLWNQSWGNNLAWNLQAQASSTQTGITFRNNLLVAPNIPSGNVSLLAAVNGSPVPATILSASDGNRIVIGGGTPNWSAGFSTGNGTLATWQAATTFDDNSAVGTTDPLTNSSSVPVDATLVAASAPIDAGVTAPGVYLDYAGHIRTGTMDVGAYSYGDSTEPTPPVSLPGAPSISVSARTDRSVTLAIVEGGGQENYVVNYAVHPYDEDGDGWTVFNASLDGDAESVEVTGLDPDTEYDFGVWAENSFGESDIDQVTATTLPASNDSQTIVSAAGDIQYAAFELDSNNGMLLVSVTGGDCQFEIEFSKDVDADVHNDELWYSINIPKINIYAGSRLAIPIVVPDIDSSALRFKVFGLNGETTVVMNVIN